MRYLDYIEYVKFDGNVHLFCFKPFSASFVEKICLEFCSYLINIPAVYSQRREASGFSYFNLKIKDLKPANLILVSLGINPSLQ